MKKVMLLANTSWYLYNFRASLVRSLLECGYEVVTCAPYDAYTSKLRSIGAEHISIELSQRGTDAISELQTVLRIRRILNTVKPNVLLTFTPKGNIYPALVKPKCTIHIPNVSGLGEGFDRKTILYLILKLLFKRAFRNSQKVLFQNREDMEGFLKTGIIKPEKAIRIYGSGVDLKKFIPRRGANSNGKVRFLTFGRIVPQKGYSFILELVEKYPDLHKNAEFHVLGIPDTSRHSSLKLHYDLKTAEAKGLLYLHAPSDNVIPYLHDADCLLFPSTYNEGVPRSLIEGLACGLPIITTDWKGCRDTVINNANGYLIKPGSLEDLYEKVKTFIALPEEEKVLYSKESRKLAEFFFDEQKIISTYLELIL